MDLEALSSSQEPLRKGMVTWISQSQCKVLSDGELYVCLLSQDVESSLVVGDIVSFTVVNEKDYIIKNLHIRQSFFARINDNPPYNQQLLAANIDAVVIVVAPNKKAIKTKLIDRCLISAKRGGVDALICLNKIDLIDSEVVDLLDNDLQVYRELQLPIQKCSAETGEGIDALKEVLSGKKVVFVGHSGVGKSSLINALAPQAKLVIGEVRESDGRGRHTTTSSKIVQLSDGTCLIDTPGFKSFSIGDKALTDLQYYFDEFNEYRDKCKFTDCSHTDEPNCQIKWAVREGKISRKRYESYLRLLGKDPSPLSKTAFKCIHCGSMVSPNDAGTKHRNHCPHCLYSLHLDFNPGDRAACCGGVMEPVAVWVRKGNEWAIIHRCQECSALSSNRIAADDNEFLLLSLAVKPLSTPPFPLEHLIPQGQN